MPRLVRVRLGPRLRRCPRCGYEEVAYDDTRASSEPIDLWVSESGTFAVIQKMVDQIFVLAEATSRELDYTERKRFMVEVLARLAEPAPDGSRYRPRTVRACQHCGASLVEVACGVDVGPPNWFSLPALSFEIVQAGREETEQEIIRMYNRFRLGGHDGGTEE